MKGQSKSYIYSNNKKNIILIKLHILNYLTFHLLN